ncbi:MAG: inverse autotransporter beta domain-containing protein [Planctomycetaceae bacterium]
MGDQPGVVRLAGQETIQPPAPVPPAGELTPQPVPHSSMSPSNSVTGPYYVEQGNSAPFEGTPVEYSDGGLFETSDFAPFMHYSNGVPESPVLGRRPYENPLFGPQLMFQTNIGDGLGYTDSYHTANARIPYHVVPGSTVLIGDLSASYTNGGQDLFNFGLIWRNYDASRNRIFGWNVYGDIDDGRGNRKWRRVGFGLESLGKYLDFRANGYYVTGDDTRLLSSTLGNDLTFTGNSALRVRTSTRDNAYSGFDLEAGGPLPYVGRRGINGYVGGYWLNNDTGYETAGFSARVQALATESATVNFNYTQDETFGSNGWVNISYTIPNYHERTLFQQKCVRDRLADPVYRTNRIHTNIDVVRGYEAAVNPKTNTPFNIVYVDPNLTAAGSGTAESPFNNLQVVADTNNPGIHIIRVTPNSANSGTNLTVDGGLTLFDCQTLASSLKDIPLFTENGVEFILPLSGDPAGLGPLISDPSLVAGDSVVRLANFNTVLGTRIDASNSTHTVFGTGISNPLPIEDVNITMNTFTNYDTAVNLQNVSGRAVLDMNTVNGLAMASKNGATSGSGTFSKRGLVLSTASNQEVEVLVRNNSVNNSMFTDPAGTVNTSAVKNDQTTVGISVTANPQSIILADDPSGAKSSGVTGILDNVVQNSGDGIVLTAQAGGRFDAVVDNNQSFNNARNGLIARADGGRFNMFSMSNNLLGGEDLDASGTLDPSEDTNGDGILDTGEDLNGNRILDPSEDVNFNGVLDNGEDTNGNGVLDPSEDANGNGILDAGEDVDFDGILRPAEDVNGDGLLAAGNGENGALLHYLNGGSFFAVSEDRNDDKNFNGIQDNGETTGPDGVFDVLNGTLNTGEDVNGNGRLDLGIFSNNMNDNDFAGLCIVGEDASDGSFTIGGPQQVLGNRFYQNKVAGIGIDLRDDATMSVDSMFNVIGRSAKLQTLVTNVGATLALTGDTFQASHTLTNTSVNTLPNSAVPLISNFTWNLTRPVGSQGFEIDTKDRHFDPVFVNGVFSGYNTNLADFTGIRFQPTGGTAANTQLAFVNGLDFNQPARCSSQRVHPRRRLRLSDEH